MCRAGAYQEALDKIHYDRIYQGQSKVIIHQLGAYDTNLSVMLEYFPDGDTTKEPQVNNAADKTWILNAIGFCFMNLGRLRETVQFYERASLSYLEGQDWSNASSIYRNLAQLHIYLGALEASAEAAAEALNLARRADHKFGISQSLSYQGWTAHLLGELQSAKDIFNEAEHIEIERHNKQVSYLYSNRGIFHADHLRRMGQSDYSRRVTVENLRDRENRHLINQLSDCHRVLGDLVSDSGNHASARAHYESALKIARSISHRRVLIEALLARGRFLAKHMKDANTAFSDLNEALGYCIESGYRIYEADVRVALGWANLAISSQQSAKTEAERALQMSNEMGYHWGKVDAKEVLERIESGE